jgi:hypothetical protein
MRARTQINTIATTRHTVARSPHFAANKRKASNLAIPADASAWYSSHTLPTTNSTQRYAGQAATAFGVVGASSLFAMPSIAAAAPSNPQNQTGTLQGDETGWVEPKDWNLDVPSFVIAFVAGMIGLLSIQKATKYLTRNSENVDADTAFLKTIANDTGVKALTDLLYGLEKIPAAIVKLANDPNAPLGAGWFYSSDNPLMKPFLLLTEGGTTPLSEADKDRLLEFAALPDFIRTPLVALRYSLMIGQLKANLSKSNDVAIERQKYYRAKLYSEIARAGLTITDFTISMVGSAFILSGNWEEAMYCLAASHAMRGATGASMITSGFFGFKDAIKEDEIKTALAEEKGETHNSRNPEVIRRALESLAIAAAIMSVEGYVLVDYAAGLDADLSMKEQVALLKSSAAATMPFVLSMILGAAQSAGAVYGVVKNRTGFKNAGAGKEKQAYGYGLFSSSAAAVAAFFYTTPIYFGFGALIRGLTGPFSAKSITMLNEVNAEKNADGKG